MEIFTTIDDKVIVETIEAATINEVTEATATDQEMTQTQRQEMISTKIHHRRRQAQSGQIVRLKLTLHRSQ